MGGEGAFKSPVASPTADAGSSSPPGGTGSKLLKALSVKLKDTYRKTDPSRPSEVRIAPRRVLTQPSAPASNG